MTLQLLHSEFPYIWGKFDFFYQCGIGLSYRHARLHGWRAGTTTLCRSWLYPPVMDLWIRLLIYWTKKEERFRDFSAETNKIPCCFTIQGDFYEDCVVGVLSTQSQPNGEFLEFFFALYTNHVCCFFSFLIVIVITIAYSHPYTIVYISNANGLPTIWQMDHLTAFLKGRW